MALDVLVGLQWGDEGKGKIVDLLASNYDIVARFQGGPNAGHTLVINGTKYVLHTIPSGIIHPNTTNVIGAGTVIDPIVLQDEIVQLEQASIDVQSRLWLSDKAHIIMPTHKLLDQFLEEEKGAQKIGSTLRGIGPTYQDKYARVGLRIGQIHDAHFQERYQELRKYHLNQLHYLGFDEHEELDQMEQTWFAAIEFIRALYCGPVEDKLNDALDKDSKMLAEGAQGTLLDIAFGSYPFVTSSHTLSGAACIGLGVAPQRIKKVIGIYKAYLTRVGSGPFPTELSGDDGKKLMKHGNEYGSTTGRERRCGWLDLELLHKTVRQNGVTDLVMTKIDVLNCLDRFKSLSPTGNLTEHASWTEDLSTINHYDSIPTKARDYIEHIERALSTPHYLISTGPSRDHYIKR